MNNGSGYGGGLSGLYYLKQQVFQTTQIIHFLVYSLFWSSILRLFCCRCWRRWRRSYGLLLTVATLFVYPAVCGGSGGGSSLTGCGYYSGGVRGGLIGLTAETTTSTNKWILLILKVQNFHSINN